LPDLNPQQKAAIQYVGGPLLVLAGAGSGKTSVITHKIAWLVRSHGLAPQHITAVTFTNKAAREMKTRVGDLLAGEQARQLSISTFHTLGLNILRRHLAETGHRPGFSIYDSEDSGALIGKLVRAQGGAKNAVDSVRYRISRWKNDLVSPEQAAQIADDAAGELAARTYAEYERNLRIYNAFDFDDLILKPLRLFEERREILEQWRGRIRYLLVDEYQDTNLCQYRLVKLLTAGRGMLTVVGDDDQSIYGWRGAHPENLKILGEDYPDLRVIKLEQNYRSSGRILKAANELIAKNPHLYDKKLWCDSGPGEAIRVLRARNEEHEAERVVSSLLHHKFRQNTEFRDYAILFRENHQARALERVLREQRIPYYLSGASSFFDRTEIKDILAYLRLLCNPRDDTSFLRVVNTPRREIGPATLEALAALAGESGTSLLEAARDPRLGERLPSRSLASLRAFTVWLEGLAERVDQEPPAPVLNRLLDDIGYADWLRDTCNDQKIAQIRMENVLELVDWVRRLAAPREGEATLADAVTRLTLIGMLDPENGEGGADNVSLMTLHSAKGLEFPHVFVVGMEEGVLPHHACQDEQGVCEERRLAYVGITRARRSLTFSFAESRRRGGDTVTCAPSRFLEELPRTELVWDEPGSGVTPARADSHLQQIRALLERK
jgi:ATP-dependent DNA helicase Rep